MPRRFVRCANAPCVGTVLMIYPKGAVVPPQTCGHANCPQQPRGTRGFGQPKGGKRK